VAVAERPAIIGLTAPSNVELARAGHLAQLPLALQDDGKLTAGARAVPRHDPE
jgi:hypothetical protein